VRYRKEKKQQNGNIKKRFKRGEGTFRREEKFSGNLAKGIPRGRQGK